MNSISAKSQFRSECVDDEAGHSQDAYVELILGIMRARGISQRTIADRAGISKSRIGRILHNTRSQRDGMYIEELHRLLRAIDLDITEAVICTAIVRDYSLAHDPRYRPVLMLLARLYRAIPLPMIEQIEKLEGIDGSEVRASWAPHLKDFVIDKVINAVVEVIRRRDAVFDGDIYKLR